MSAYLKRDPEFQTSVAFKLLQKFKLQVYVKICYCTYQIAILKFTISRRKDETTVGPFTVKSVFSVSPPTLFELVCLINSDI